VSSFILTSGKKGEIKNEQFFDNERACGAAQGYKNNSFFTNEARAIPSRNQNRPVQALEYRRD